MQAGVAPSLDTARCAQAAVDSPHLALQLIHRGRAGSVGRTPRSVLVEHVCEKVLLLIRKAVEKREEMGFVAKDHLGSDGRRGGGLTHSQRTRT